MCKNRRGGASTWRRKSSRRSCSHQRWGSGQRWKRRTIKSRRKKLLRRVWSTLQRRMPVKYRNQRKRSHLNRRKVSRNRQRKKSKINHTAAKTIHSCQDHSPIRLRNMHFFVVWCPSCRFGFKRKCTLLKTRSPRISITIIKKRVECGI